MNIEAQSYIPSFLMQSLANVNSNNENNNNKAFQSETECFTREEQQQQQHHTNTQQIEKRKNNKASWQKETVSESNTCEKFIKNKIGSNNIIPTSTHKVRRGKKNYKAGKRIVYNKQELLELQNLPAVRDFVTHDIIVEVKPHGLLPLRFARLLNSPTSLEYLNVESIEETIRTRPTRSTSMSDKKEIHFIDNVESTESVSSLSTTTTTTTATPTPMLSTSSTSTSEELMELLLSLHHTDNPKHYNTNCTAQNETKAITSREDEGGRGKKKVIIVARMAQSPFTKLSSDGVRTDAAEVVYRICSNLSISISDDNSDNNNNKNSNINLPHKKIMPSLLLETLPSTEFMQSLRNYKCSECGPHISTLQKRALFISNTTTTTTTFDNNTENTLSTTTAATIAEGANNDIKNKESEEEEEQSSIVKNNINASTDKPVGCKAIHCFMACVHKEIVSSREGVCLMQGGDVIWGMLQLALVFEHKQSSMRMRQLAEKFPALVRNIGEFLYGTGYHIALPPITAHDAWTALLRLLCFDNLRDNTTRVVTDLSKHWRRRTTPFEQFVYFFAFRDDRPRSRVRNIITRSVKPGMVAMLSGNVLAMTLLHYLGFYTPHDYYWYVFPFLYQALSASSSSSTIYYDIIRHLGHYLSSRQDTHLYNPLGLPFVDDHNHHHNNNNNTKNE